MSDVVIVSAARTAIGTFGGSLADTSNIDLASAVIKEAVDRAGIDAGLIDEVVLGCVGQIGESGFLTRAASLKAGLPLSVTGYSVNRQCGSGLQALVEAFLLIKQGRADLVVAGGVENMSALPYYLHKARFGYKMGHGVLDDGLTSILTWPNAPYHNGKTAENLANLYSISRKEQDDYAYKSQLKAKRAIEKGEFRQQILPMQVGRGKSAKVFDTDEHPKDLGREKLDSLKPAFDPNGSVTAANASGINDGAAALLLTSRKKAKELGLKPVLHMQDYEVAGLDPDVMGLGPVWAIKKLLERMNISLKDIDNFEINEAFAVQALACAKELGLDLDKLNTQGGAIALGHPVGASGAILPVKIFHQNHSLSIASLCIGGGQGICAIFKKE